MRVFVIVTVWLVIVLAPALARAQDADALRREL